MYVLKHRNNLRASSKLDNLKFLGKKIHSLKDHRIKIIFVIVIVDVSGNIVVQVNFTRRYAQLAT